MANCKYCGGVLDPSKNYCVYCDSPVEQEAQSSAETAENVETSEAETSEAENYEETTYDSTTEQEESSWTDKAKSAGSVIGTVLGAALGASLFGRRHRKPILKQPPMKQGPVAPIHSRPVQRTTPHRTGMPAGQMNNAPGGKPMGNPQTRGTQPGGGNRQNTSRPGGSRGAAGGIGRNVMSGPGGRSGSSMGRPGGRSGGGSMGGRGGHGSGGPMGRR